jgi:hypothetical protein
MHWILIGCLVIFAMVVIVVVLAACRAAGLADDAKEQALWGQEERLRAQGKRDEDTKPYPPGDVN